MSTFREDGAAALEASTGSWGAVSVQPEAEQPE